MLSIDPWFIVGSREKWKERNRRQKINFPPRPCKGKQRNELQLERAGSSSFLFVFAFFRMGEMTTCSCMGRNDSGEREPLIMHGRIMTLKGQDLVHKQRSWLQTEQESFIIYVFNMYTGTEAGRRQMEGVGVLAVFF